MGVPKVRVRGFHGWVGTHWIPKRGSSTARLSHKPSMANLLAQ